ncbi:MAG TPA: tetratricopeptide repeat protein [Candidatus Saccharimonadales bacterium]|nr:tetratricopeptide repeat protein [Candidatus Saccharimonadales bacterium]
MATKKLTRRELREDPIYEFLKESWEWLQLHLREVLIGAGAVAVVAVLVVLWQAQGRRNEEAASELLLKAEFLRNSGDAPASLATLHDIQARYAGSPSATRALRDEGDLDFMLGKYADAQKQYQKFLDKVGPKGIEGRAGLGGLAACYDQTRQFEKAAETYGKVADIPGGGELSAMALWAEGRCWRAAGKLDRAEAAYQRLMSEYRTSRYAPVAKMALAEVRAQAGR